MSEFTLDQLETILQRSIKARDWEGVRAALKLVSVQDPRRAEELLDTIRLGIDVGRIRP